MDVSVKISEKKSIVVGPFDKSESTEFLLSRSNISEGIILSGNNTEKYDDYIIYSCMSGSEDQESETSRIICGNRHKVTSCETTDCSEICINETDVTKQSPIVCSSTVLNTLEARRSTETSGVEIASNGTNDESSASIRDVSGKFKNNGGEITNENERVIKVSINAIETNDGLTICTKTTDELLITCNEKAEAPLECKDILAKNITKSGSIVSNTGRNKLLQIVYEIEKFFDAINSTNKDMQKKSTILLHKQNLVEEIMSYIQAVQSIIRLSIARSLFSKTSPQDSVTAYSKKPFYEAGEPFFEAGEHILEELGLYRRELQADFKVWESHRREILEISDQMPCDFEYCEDEMSAKVLMHDISTRICDILKLMEMVTSKREDNNENSIDLMDSVDTYIRYSSAFIIGDRTIFRF